MNAEGHRPAALRGTFALALACNVVLELVQLLGVEGYPWRYKSPAFPLMFLLGTLVLWLVVGLVHALVGRLGATAVVVLPAVVLLAVANEEKVRFRREPLYPADWRFVGDLGPLTRMAGTRAVVLFAVLLGIVGAALWLVLRRHRRPASRHSTRGRTRSFVLRGTVALSCLLGLAYVGQFNAPGNVVRGTYEMLGADWRPWSQQRNYLGNGFVAGTLYNLDVPAMAPPAGYSRATMARIVQRYRASADRINRTRDPYALRRTNVVLVLSESFSDPTELAGVTVSEDPIPFTRRLMTLTPSGHLLAQNIGGGTANMEFEALTGMSLSLLPPQLRVPYQTLVTDRARFPSLVPWFEQQGHRTVAIHPYTTEMYRRRDVYRSFGFDEFVYDEKMHDQRRSGHRGYISDRAAFAEVARQIGTSSRPVLLHLVTMQNHIPYGDRYADPVRVAGPDGKAVPEAGQYARGLRHSDEALRGLLDRLRALDERTVLILYGDHLPGIWPTDVVEANSRATMRSTPLLVWSSFDGAPTALPPLTSPVQLVDLAVQRAGGLVSPYLALLHELRRQLPALESGMMFGPDGEPLRGSRLPHEAARLLHDYRLVQYDLSSGDRYAEEMIAPPAAAPFGSAPPGRH